MTAEDAIRHLRTLGTLHIVLGILGVLLSIVIYVIITAGGIISGDGDAIAITQIIAIGVSSFIFLLSIPGIIGGLGIMKHKFWAKIVLLIVGLLNLLSFPLGTALGVYTFWVLLQSEVDKVLEER